MDGAPGGRRCPNLVSWWRQYYPFGALSKRSLYCLSFLARNFKVARATFRSPSQDLTPGAKLAGGYCGHPKIRMAFQHFFEAAAA